MTDRANQTMRERFVDVSMDLLDTTDDLMVVLADIGVSAFAARGALDRFPDRIVNVGIREQLMVGVGAGLALTGRRPIVHTYAPFLVERAYEQIKLDLGHQDVGAILVSVGASYDSAGSGHTHHAAADVALMSTLDGWNVHVPGHPDEVEAALRTAATADDRTYIRLSERRNRRAGAVGRGVVPVRAGSPSAPTVVAVGPTLDPTIAALADLDVTVLYTNQPVPLDVSGILSAATGSDLFMIEPYLERTSAGALVPAADGRRLHFVGVGREEIRRYGTPAEHDRYHGLDVEGIRRRVVGAMRHHATPAA